MAGKPPTEDGAKGPARPGKAFDPRAEDWQNRGKRGFENRRPKSGGRPFKGGGRGR